MQNITEDELIINLKAAALKAPKNTHNHCNQVITLAERPDLVSAVDSCKAAFHLEPKHLAASSNLDSRDQLSVVLMDITIEFLTAIFRRNNIRPLTGIMCYFSQVYFTEIFQFNRILKEIKSLSI